MSENNDLVVGKVEFDNTIQKLRHDLLMDTYPLHVARYIQPLLYCKRLHPDAVPPTKAHPTDAGYDLTAFSREYNDEHRYWEYGTGIAVAIPEGFAGLLFPRSSISKTNLTLANSVGVIDAGYRGEVKLRYREAYRGDLSFPNLRIGEKCGQLVVVPIFGGEMVEVDELDATERGEGGFGSSGK